jgi:pimeloyl-ACP methyl ester carboxylesterase
MKINNKAISFNGALLNYTIYGQGTKALLCFHGFGQSGSNFSILEEALGQEYKIYAFDLFFHGESRWEGSDAPLEKEFFAGMISHFLVEENIMEFSLLGFSMGARFALVLTEAFAAQVKEIFLLSPDGIRTNFWNYLSTESRVGRKLFKIFTSYPGTYYFFSKIILSSGLVSKTVVKFADSQMKTAAQRNKVYYSWVVFRKMKVDPLQVAMIINRFNIPVQLYLGLHDRIIVYKHLSQFMEKIAHLKVHRIKAGHSNLIEEVARFLHKPQ